MRARISRRGRGAAVALVIVFGAVPVTASAGRWASASCTVPTLSSPARAAGDRAARGYIAERGREFAHDLMGYRRGPKLPRPTRKERRRIAEERSARLEFALNPSRLLIRRLLRDHSKAVRNSYDLIGIALTPLEVRTVNFELRFQDATGLVDAYAARCARRDDGGAYFSYHPVRAQLFVVNVTRHVDRYLDAYQERFRYRLLLRVRRVRFNLRTLNHVEDRVDADLASGWFDRHKLNLVLFGIDEERNAVVIGLHSPSRRAARILRRRYGAAVWMDPSPSGLVGPAYTPAQVKRWARCVSIPR